MDSGLRQNDKGGGGNKVRLMQESKERQNNWIPFFNGMVGGKGDGLPRRGVYTERSECARIARGVARHTTRFFVATLLQNDS